MMGIYMICDPYVSCILNPLQLFQKTQRKVLSNCSAIGMPHFNFPKAYTKKTETIERLCFCTKNCTHTKEEAEVNVLLVVVNSNDLFPPRVTAIPCAYC
jgi:hypothetical protein